MARISASRSTMVEQLSSIVPKCKAPQNKEGRLFYTLDGELGTRDLVRAALQCG